jgi:hypothetical protein
VTGHPGTGFLSPRIVFGLIVRLCQCTAQRNTKSAGFGTLVEPLEAWFLIVGWNPFADGLPRRFDRARLTNTRLMAASLLDGIWRSVSSQPTCRRELGDPELTDKPLDLLPRAPPVRLNFFGFRHPPTSAKIPPRNGRCG